MIWVLKDNAVNVRTAECRVRIAKFHRVTDWPIEENQRKSLGLTKRWEFRVHNVYDSKSTVLMRLACWWLGLHSLGAPDALPSLSTSQRAHTTLPWYEKAMRLGLMKCTCALLSLLAIDSFDQQSCIILTTLDHLNQYTRKMYHHYF